MTGIGADPEILLFRDRAVDFLRRMLKMFGPTQTSALSRPRRPLTLVTAASGWNHSSTGDAPLGIATTHLAAEIAIPRAQKPSQTC